MTTQIVYETYDDNQFTAFLLFFHWRFFARRRENFSHDLLHDRSFFLRSAPLL